MDLTSFFNLPDKMTLANQPRALHGHKHKNRQHRYPRNDLTNENETLSSLFTEFESNLFD